MSTAQIFIAKSRLDSLEAIIRQGKQTFLDVGSALSEIMEEQLYKEKGFGSFAEYCETVWGFKKSYAYQLVKSAEAVKELPPSVSTIVESLNPGQARELVKVPKAKRVAVINQAVKTAKTAGRKITAKDISAATPKPTNTVAAQEIRSIELQLRELWNQATPTERENFLEWIKEQSAHEQHDQFGCDSCGATFENDDDALTLYECGECGNRFTKESSANGNHQCPDCNKFGSKVSDSGCPECNEGELVSIRRAAA